MPGVGLCQGKALPVPEGLNIPCGLFEIRPPGWRYGRVAYCSVGPTWHDFCIHYSCPSKPTDSTARPPPIFMKSFLVLFITLGCCLAEDNNSASMPREAKVEKDHVSLRVEYLPQYADALTCTLSYQISSTNGQKHVSLFSGSAFDPDIKVRLVAPSGKVLTAYKDMPGAQFPAIPQEALFIEELAARGYDHYLDLQYLFPIEEKGEYHCTLTKRVFRNDENGTPVDIVSPEIKFLIEKVDAKVKSPLAKLVPALNKPKPPPSLVEETSLHHASHIVAPDPNVAIRR